MTKYSEGQRVRLKPWQDPDDASVSSPEEFGTALGDEDNGVVAVEVDKEFMTNPADDGFREVPVEQLEPATEQLVDFNGFHYSVTGTLAVPLEGQPPAANKVANRRGAVELARKERGQ